MTKRVIVAILWSCVTVHAAANDGYALYGLSEPSLGTVEIVRIDVATGAASAEFQLYVPDGSNVGHLTYHAPSGLLVASLTDPAGEPRLLFVHPEAGIGDHAPVSGLPATTHLSGLAYDPTDDCLIAGLVTFGAPGDFRVVQLGLDAGVLEVSDPVGPPAPDLLAWHSGLGQMIGADFNGDGATPRVVALDDLFGDPMWTPFASPPYHGGMLDMAIHPGNDRILMIRIDATGDALTELVGDDYVDIGFLGINHTIKGIAFVPQTSASAADIDGSGAVDFDDLLVVLRAWGSANPSADIAPPGGDGLVDFLDLLLVLAQWGPCA